MDVERCQAIYNEKWFSISKIHSFKSSRYERVYRNRVCLYVMMDMFPFDANTCTVTDIFVMNEVIETKAYNL